MTDDRIVFHYAPQSRAFAIRVLLEELAVPYDLDVRDIRAGDTIELGGVVLTLDEVGERANLNLTDLGHAVIYVNSPEQPLLPGAIKVSGEARPHPTTGSAIVIRGE